MPWPPNSPPPLYKTLTGGHGGGWVRGNDGAGGRPAVFGEDRHGARANRVGPAPGVPICSRDPRPPLGNDAHSGACDEVGLDRGFEQAEPAHRPFALENRGFPKRAGAYQRGYERRNPTSASCGTGGRPPRFVGHVTTPE